VPFSLFVIPGRRGGPSFIFRYVLAGERFAIRATAAILIPTDVFPPGFPLFALLADCPRDCVARDIDRRRAEFEAAFTSSFAFPPAPPPVHPISLSYFLSYRHSVWI